MRTSILFTVVSLTTLFASSSLYADTEIIPSPDPTCNQYFDAGYTYEGDFGKTLSDTLHNTGLNELDLYADEQIAPYVSVATPGIVSFTTPEFQYANPFFTNCGGTWCIGGSTGRQFTYLTSGQSFQWIQTLPNKHLQVVSVDKSKVTNANRAQIRDKFFNIRYTTKGHFWSNSSNSFVAGFNHVECQQIGVHFCGDGVVEPGKETCDPSDPARTGWGTAGCNTSCQPVVAATPSCDSLTASPTFGTSPVTTTLTCSGSNLPVGSTYAIDCGNGTIGTMNGNKGTCTYSNNTTTGSVTFVPKCTINSAITSLACQTSVGVNPLPIAGICSSTLSGALSAPISGGACAVGVPINFTSTGSPIINYSWICSGTAGGANSSACTARYTPPTTGSGTFDLQLKKYINTGATDAQPGTPLVTSTSAALSYLIRVTNSGPASSSGVTTVQDILPAGVVLDGTASGSSWSCSSSGVTIRCTSSLIVASGSTYPDITVPFRVTATAGQSVTNIAAVDNPLEANRCMADGSMPATDSTLCTRDPLNSDPAVFTIPGAGGGGGGGGASHVGAKCINSVKSCALYNSLITCEAELGVGNCDSSDAAGQTRCAAKALVCSGPGGGGGGGGGNVAGRCGDGVLQVGEECDVVGGALWCSTSCKINLSTNPGANPITDLWMTIPVLAGTQRLGYTWLDGTPGKVAFSDNRMVLGAGTKAFSLADTVGFGIRTQYQVPLMIEADRRICMRSEGTSLNSEELCTTFGAHAALAQIWTRPIDSKRYVVLGKGDFQYQTVLGGPYSVENVDKPNNVVLFKGATQYQMPSGNIGPTLNSAFFGRTPGTDGTLGLFTDTGVDLVKLQVRVSGAVVSSVGSASNRAIESFINTTNPFTGFLGTSVMMNTSTTTNNITSNPVNIALPTLIGGPTGSANTVAELERYAVNGNRNILAVTGDLTINCPTGSTVFTMTGVRSVIVTGNLIIKCNIVYGSSDSTSSWAWIAKDGGNIMIDNGNGTAAMKGITNLAGVYVATTGEFKPIDGKVTQAILRIDGSLYGNPKPLFDSRLYARATGAYDILTTGTLITYSNRALVSPPPLLSQYLGTYQVQRVVQ